nr:gastrula zinc finger protein XlCGF64.1-like [Vanessa tameamea]
MAAHLTKHVHFKPFKCSYEGCTKKFKDKGTLKKHSLIHYPDQQYVCTLCKKRFTRINRLNVHMKQHRAKEKSAVCDYCGTSDDDDDVISDDDDVNSDDDDDVNSDDEDDDDVISDDNDVNSGDDDVITDDEDVISDDDNFPFQFLQ